MSKTLYPFQFVKTMIVYGEDEDHAEESLRKEILENSDAILDDWAIDELFEPDKVWKPIVVEDK